MITALQESGKSSRRFRKRSTESNQSGSGVGRHDSEISRSPASETVHFHPVQLVGSRPCRESAAVLEVVLVDGRSVRLAEGFAAADLARVLSVLEGKESC